MKRSEENSTRCSQLKQSLESVNQRILNHEDEINQIKTNINSIQNQVRETRADMKNKMTAFGVSKDPAVNAFIRMPHISMGKDAIEDMTAPSEQVIENLMNAIAAMERDVENKEREIMSIGRKIRSLALEKDRLVREWRVLRCRSR